MSQITISQLTGDECFTVSRDLMSYAFRATPPLPSLEEWSNPDYMKSATILGLFSDEKPLACAAYSTMMQNVRSELYPNAAVWGVATHPAARRSGYSRQILSELMRHMHEAGIPFSNLYPFRESFYDRLGYTTFPQPRTVRIPAEAFAPLLRKELKGHVELTSDSDGFGTQKAYLAHQHQQTHGMALDPSAKSYGHTSWQATAIINGEPHAMMLYTIIGEEEDREMEVPCFFYDDSPGKYLLLAWFARHIDQVKYVKLHLPPGELPETWLPDLRPTIQAEEAPMGRIITVADIGGMRCGGGEFSAHISDPICPWNNDTYHFACLDGTLQVSITTLADCQLTIQGLTALVYGTHDPETFALREWGDPSPELQARMRAMFPPQLPYLYSRY
ncbi:GNAT family N-acetyltransferase [Ktedonobacter robiniae]|uniref:N-acetyltransferase domain-containing protein n=1 Tax=Ktedonobacter robiniae TaxID=2778365 RepID=A0ABQ3UXI8_9CHLR|nr:GNAT family N-acetyltransferase [Ktedonobacter robiniae]GHO57382.1 hypothetical protein KSB_58570 [Ktedonobacter robiniae]